MKKRKLCNLDSDRVDMFLPLFCRDFLMSTIGWTATQRGHYLTLLMVQWDAGSLPQDLDALERISDGISEAWNLLEDKFPVAKDGLRRNMRLEEHRTTAVEIRKKRRENGRRGGKPKGNQMGTQMVTQMGNQCQTSAEPGLEHPEPEPEPQSLSYERELGGTSPVPQAESPKAKPAGHASPVWERLLTAWNEAAGRCRHIARYDSFHPPQSFLDRHEELGWDEDFPKGIARLERCQWFTTPVALTFFLKPDSLQSILAGAYDPKKPTRPGETPNRPPIVSSRMWRDDACQNMTDEQYAAWRRSKRDAALAGKAKT